MIELRDVAFAYDRSGFRLCVPQLDVADGEKVALIGPSGSGKTTLISLIAGILTPHAGRIVVAGQSLAGASDAARRNFRIRHIGFVFQEFELLDYLSVRENILLPYFINRSLPLDRAVRQRADALAESMGLGRLLRRHPRAISHGEKQRVAICRALVTEPPLLITDEPTGNLDPRTADTILDLLLAAVVERGATLLTVTHNHALLDRFHRTIDIAEFARTGDVAGASA